MKCEQVRGFNYQPSWGSSGFEIWRHFDAGCMSRELAAGKRHFPGMNAIRLWLSHDAWLRNPHHSLVADAHRGKFGPLSAPGNLAFLETDDSLCPGHEVFNQF